MSETIYFASLCLPLGTILLVFAMRAIAATQQARAKLAHDDAYRLLTQATAAAQTDTAAALLDIQASLADVKTRIASIETILKAVE